MIIQKNAKGHSLYLNISEALELISTLAQSITDTNCRPHIKVHGEFKLSDHRADEITNVSISVITPGNEDYVRKYFEDRQSS
jgi:hypothetical protein